MSSEKWTSAMVRERIAMRFGERRRYAVFYEVNEGTGLYGKSWIDVAVFSLWPSDGLHRYAFEVKVSRQDFLHELAQPMKNAWARDCFHAFYFATAPGVVKSLDEIPEGCGWYVATANGLQLKKAATLKAAPILDDGLMASCMRSSQGAVEVAVKEARAAFRENDQEVLRGRAVTAAVNRFFRARGGHYTSAELLGEEGIYDELMSLATNDDARAMQRRIQDALEQVQSTYEDLLWKMAALGAIGFESAEEFNRAFPQYRKPDQDLILRARKSRREREQMAEVVASKRRTRELQAALTVCDENAKTREYAA